jgi:hypothetical protein
MSNLFQPYRHILNAISGEDWVQWRPGRVKFRCCFAERHKNGDQNWSGAAKIGEQPDGLGLMLLCTSCGAKSKDYAAFTRINFRDFLPSGSQGRRRDRMDPKPQPVARYDYRDASGQILATKVRLEPGWDDRKKDFLWERPLTPEQMNQANLPHKAGYTRGKGSLSEGMFAAVGVCIQNKHPFEYTGDRDKPHTVKLPAVELPLFRLPQLLASKTDRPVFIVEGEKDVLTVESLGFIATCPPHGKSVWDHAWADHFIDRLVVVIPDNDHGGLMHAKNIVGSLVCAGAAAVRFLQPGQAGFDLMPNGGDVSDWLAKIPPDMQRKAILSVCEKTRAYRVSVPSKVA